MNKPFYERELKYLKVKAEERRSMVNCLNNRITFIHENTENYMMILWDEQKIEYGMQILQYNQVKGLLGLQYRMMDESLQLRYNISSKVSLADFLINKKIGKEYLRQIMNTLFETMEEMKEYLLDCNALLLEMKYIFVDMRSEAVHFCFVPFLTDTFDVSFRNLIQELLQYVDYDDREGTEYIYNLNTWCGQGNFDLLTLRNYIGDVAQNGVEESEKMNEEQEWNLNNEDSLDELFYHEDEKPHLDFHGFLHNLWDKLCCWCKRKNQENLVEDLLEEACLGENADKQTVVNEKEDFNSNTFEDDGQTVYISDARKYIKRQLVELRTGTGIFIEKYPFILGKIVQNVDYVISEKSISRMQAKLDFMDGKYFIQDLNSKNGTYVNEERINPFEIREIQIGDRIGLADIDYIFR